MLEGLHGAAAGYGLLPYPGKGVLGPIDWFLIVISAPLAIALNRALRRVGHRRLLEGAMYLFKLCFSFSGRINRAKFWLVAVIQFGIGQVGLISGHLSSDAKLMPLIGIIMWFVSIISWIVCIVVSLANATKRLHDLDFSGWWAVGVFAVFEVTLLYNQWPTFTQAPIYLIWTAIIILLVNCAFIIWLGSAKGMEGENRFGPPPIYQKRIKPPKQPFSDAERSRSNVDYYPIIARAVANLTDDTANARQAVFDRAYKVLVTQLRAKDPPASEQEIAREQRALAAAINRVEGRAIPSMASTSSTPKILTKTNTLNLQPSFTLKALFNLFQKLGASSAVVLYIALGIAQIAAYLAGIKLWLGIGTFLGLLIFFGTAGWPFMAIVDTGIGFYGALAAWHWSWWASALLTFPFAIIGIMLSAAEGMTGIFRFALRERN